VSGRHVRAGDQKAAALVTLGLTASPTFRLLVDALGHSDLIVYVQTRPMSLPGRLQFAAVASGSRYVRVSVRVPGRDADLVAWLGHELQHAVELASAPEVVDQDSLIRYYERIGMRRSEAAVETIAAPQVAADTLSGLTRIEREIYQAAGTAAPTWCDRLAVLQREVVATDARPRPEMLAEFDQLRTELAGVTGRVRAEAWSDASTGASDAQYCSAAISLDTKGVEFNPWIRRFAAQIKRQWRALPEAPNGLGPAVVTFTVTKSGRIEGLTLKESSGTASLDTAALKALAGANPTYALPKGVP
jgi:TonB family protein